MSKEGVNPDGSVRKRDDQLARRVYSEAWGTPRASDGMKGKLRKIPPGQNCRARLEDQVAQKHGAGGHLNPTWVEAYLMGWPVAWTSMEPLPKEVFQEWERTFLTGPIDSNALATDKPLSVRP